MKRTLVAGLLALMIVVSLPLVAGCVSLEVTEGRSASLSAAGVSTVRIHAEAGLLEVVGGSDMTEVSVVGTARARNTEDLDDVQIVTLATDSEIIVELKAPGDTKLDARIEMPDSCQVIIDDGSGSLVVSGVLEAHVTDGSGDVEIRAVGGDVEVEDGSGDITIANVGLNVDIVADGSGDITVSDVAGSVRVRDDGSGDIVAQDVDGDLVVDDDGSGNIRYSNIRGRLDIPND